MTLETTYSLFIRGRRLRTLRIVAFAASIGAGCAFCAAPCAAQDVVVNYDQSQLLRLERPAADIIVGNPSIADVAVQSSTSLVVTGKSFGITNLIVLDRSGAVAMERRVVVVRDELRLVNVHRGGKRQSYSCAPECNPTITVGDDAQFFETVAKLSERKMKLSVGQIDLNADAGQ